MENGSTNHDLRRTCRTSDSVSTVYWVPHGFRILIAAAIIWIGTCSSAYAYVDPGSSALIWQALLAGLFGAMFYARNIIRNIKTWLSGLKKNLKK